MTHPHLFTYLTQREFKACFALVFVAQSLDYRDCYPLDDYATPGSEDTPLSQAPWEESIRRAGRYLALEHGYPFQALSFLRDGRINAPAQGIEPGNLVYGELLKAGGLPDPEHALETAISLLSEVQGFDLEPLRQALLDLRKSREDVLLHSDPRAEEAAMAEMDRALLSVGVVRGGGKVN